MSAFKDQLNKDLDIFFNPAEFGEEHVIDGKPVTCVIDNDLNDSFKGDLDGGVFVSIKRLHVRETDLARKPAQGKVMVIDGDPYMVLSISQEIGVLVVTVAQDCTT